jgi:hypothetical protein
LKAKSYCRAIQAKFDFFASWRPCYQNPCLADGGI